MLVNNSGTNWAEAMENYSLKAFDKVMGLNVRAVFILTRFAVPVGGMLWCMGVGWGGGLSVDGKVDSGSMGSDAGVGGCLGIDWVGLEEARGVVLVGVGCGYGRGSGCVWGYVTFKGGR